MATLDKLTNAVKNIFIKSDVASVNQVAHQADIDNTEMDMRQREVAIYGSDRITKQKLYEKWAVKNSWHLKDQAIPLLLCMDPDTYKNSFDNEDNKKEYEDLWQHAQHCVEQGLLVINNRESLADEWEAQPVDVYKWAAISRVQLPEQLTFLMEFVLKSTISTTSSRKENASNAQLGSSSNYDKSKEDVLGAALAVLVAYPERCRNKKAQLRAENIQALINENEKLLFGDDLPELSSTARLDIINKWIKKLP